MSATLLAFFATPLDQRSWLSSILGQAGVWCYMRRQREATALSVAMLESLSFEGHELEFHLWIGFDDLSPPVWRESAPYPDIDTARSLAIEFLPSFVHEHTVLLSGQIAILRKSQYKEAGIDPRPLKRRFDRFVQSLRNDAANEDVYLLNPETGATRDCPDILITKAAVEWQRAGKLLKQFSKGLYEFRSRKRED